jgi:hypothetical protein
VPDFQSVHHPGDASAVRVYGRALVTPLGTCMLPLMIMATVQVLDGIDPLPYVAVGGPLAFLIAVGWTRFRLASRMAELHTYPGMAALRSIDDVVRDVSLDWKPVFDVRDARGEIHVTLGHETRTLIDREWPDHETLVDALRSARYDRTDQPPPSRAASSTTEPSTTERSTTRPPTADAAQARSPSSPSCTLPADADASLSSSSSCSISSSSISSSTSPSSPSNPS